MKNLTGRALRITALCLLVLGAGSIPGCADVDDAETAEAEGEREPVSLGEGALQEEGVPSSVDAPSEAEADLIIPEEALGEVTGEVAGEKKLFPSQPLSPVADASTLPARAVTQLIVTYKNGVIRRCTGTIVGRDAVLTAAHCVFNKERGGFAKTIEVIPGRNGDAMPFGRTWSAASFCPQEYQDNDPNLAKVPFDYGIIRTKALIGDSVGKVAIATANNVLNLGLRLRGYPDDSRPHIMFTSADKVRKTFANGIFYHQASTLSGLSGGGVFAGSSVFGVHVGETPDGANNDGVLITQAVRTKLNDYMSRAIVR